MSSILDDFPYLPHSPAGLDAMLAQPAGEQRRHKSSLKEAMAEELAFWEWQEEQYLLEADAYEAMMFCLAEADAAMKAEAKRV